MSDLSSAGTSSKTSFQSILLKDINKLAAPVNKKRYRSFDLIRGFAVFFMIFIHVVMLYSEQYLSESIFVSIAEFFGGPPAAPVFMFFMGTFFVLSSKTADLKYGVSRGFKIYLLGLILSFLREDVFLFGKGNLTILDFTFPWEVDILQFAGIALILMSIVMYLLKKPLYWAVLAAVVTFVSPLLWTFSFDNLFLVWLTGPIIGGYEDVYFPVFAWIAYPLIGMVFGATLRSMPDIIDVFQSWLPIGIVLFAIGGILVILDYGLHIGDYWRTGPGGIMWITGFALLWSYLLHRISEKIENYRSLDFIYYWGRNVTSIYFIHWLFLSWSFVLVREENTLGLGGTFLMLCLTCFVAHYLSKGYDRFKYRNKQFSS